MFFDAKIGIYGSVAEWSEALVLGTSLFGGVDSNPTAANCFFLKSERYANVSFRNWVLFLFFCILVFIIFHFSSRQKETHKL